MKPLIIANWKCNPIALREAKLLFDSVKKGVGDTRNVEIVICPPFIYLPIIIPQNPSAAINFGGQNCFWEDPPTGGGAFTGEISPLMLKNLGVEYVIIGHSERRKYQRETNEIVNKKLGAALAVGLKSILCINKISQLPENIRNWKLEIGNLILAYEPLFAIGTGKPCLPEKAKKMRILIREKINVPVLYGGSVNSQNAKEYIDKAGFQGLLVGGASLKAKEFIKIIRSVS